MCAAPQARAARLAPSGADPIDQEADMATRNGSAEWRGDLQGGSGDLTVGDGVFSGNYSFASRFEAGEGTNPEELIAAAHAACFSMALSLKLGDHHAKADELVVSAAVTLDEVDGAPTVVSSAVEVEGAVPGMSADDFAAVVAEAAQLCPISRLFAGANVTATGQLREG
jgi:lipoyl-dependent peroxiredoxin